MKPYYHDDAVTIYYGDCREILPSLPKVDLVLTDPPYGEVNETDSGSHGQLRKLDKGFADVIENGTLDVLSRIEAETFYVWCGVGQVSIIRNDLKFRGFTVRLGGWLKTNPSPMNGEHLWLSAFEACVFARRAGAIFNEKCKGAIWTGPTSTETDHPTEKPIWLFQRLILASSNESQIIFDPFMGSGTTLRAAKDLGRKAIGIEIEEKYCEIAAKRMAQEVLL
jgi:site-specific DNA-methyltransferase (adenine-specific)